MSLLDRMQLMTTMGTAPERQYRMADPVSPKDAGFAQEMNVALHAAARTLNAEAGGSVLENALMHNALNGLASLLPQRSRRSTARDASTTPDHEGIGALSARFESGAGGVGAIGYDRNGGTSYGTYQIASKPGTMSRFIEYREEKAPEWASALKSAGPANTGSTQGGMPAAWKKIADRAPEQFERMQREFIAETHYEPARDKILANTGVDVNTLPAAVQEALWSTAVQHGAAGAAGIFSRAISAAGNKAHGTPFAQKLIDLVYEDRKRNFASSTAAVQSSVRGRMNIERDMALAILNRNESSA